MKFHLSTVFMFLALSLTGCTSFFGDRVHYVENTRIEIRNSGNGRYYAVPMGASATTTVEAVWGPGDQWSIAYRYNDTKPLEVYRLSMETSSAMVSVDSINPTRLDNGEGRVTEADTMETSKALFEAILGSKSPVIFIEGNRGKVVIEMGDQSKANLKELLEYAGGGAGK